jgi:Rod binding domain-containing protein
MADSISSITGILPSASGGAKPRDIPAAAQQFEALMLHQMLQSARGSEGSWFGTGDGEDQAGAQAMEIAQEQFAGALAAQGGIGLAKMIVSRLMPNDNGK